MASEEILEHRGAGLTVADGNDELEFHLMAEIKGLISSHPDSDSLSQLRLRALGQHAFATAPGERDTAREFLDLMGETPDDETMQALLSRWREELYRAHASYISASAVVGDASRWSG